MGKIVELGPTVAEVAGMIGRHQEHVRRLIRGGQLTARRVGRRYHVHQHSLDAYLRQGDGDRLKLAARWLAMVDDRGRADEIVSLLDDTFHLDKADRIELVGAWRRHAPQPRPPTPKSGAKDLGIAQGLRRART